MFATTRRQVLGTLVTAAGAVLAPRWACSQPRPQKPGGLRVSVHAPGGAHFRGDATVSLWAAGADAIVLPREPAALTYVADLPAGTLRLRVTTPGSEFAPIDQAVALPAEGLSLPVYLGKPGWPSFRIGQSEIPFEPKEDLCAVAFLGPRPTTSSYRRLIDSARRAGFTPFPDSATFLSHSGTIAMFRWTGSSGSAFFDRDRRDGPDLVSRLRRALSEWDVRVGMPIDTRPGHLKILDNQYVVQLAPRVSSGDVRVLATKYGFSARPVNGFDDTWLFESANRSDYRKHLESAKLLLASDDRSGVRSIEPNLLFELQQHACTDDTAVAACTNANESVPLDPWGTCEQNLTLQEVTQAWCFLEQRLGTASRYGSDAVCVATVDAAGINKDHPDASTVEYVSLCSDCAEMPEDSHGMSVFGIVSAKPGNGAGTAGMAPGVRHVAIRPRRQWTETVSYAQMIEWAAGVAFAAEMPRPLGKVPDVIVCSHGLADLPTPSRISDSFYKVTDEGRFDLMSGRKVGTVLVYSAGNAHTDIDGTQGFAAHPRVIAVGNTMPPDSSGKEVRAANSNFGFALSICAQGEGAPSLLADPVSSAPGQCVPPRGNTAGAAEFGGTSAACAMVGATAALMLSVNPTLTWVQVRDLLRDSAQCVDAEGGLWIDHRSYYYGSGRLSTYKAVMAAASVMA